jgi:preprotein translocase subunit SecG
MVQAITVIHLICCLLIILVVLAQSGKSSGLSSAITGTSETFLAKNRSRSLDSRLAKLTKWFAVAFVIITIVLNIVI